MNVYFAAYVDDGIAYHPLVAADREKMLALVGWRVQNVQYVVITFRSAATGGFAQKESTAGHFSLNT